MKQFLNIYLLVILELSPKYIELVSSFFIKIVEMLIVMIMCDDFVHINKLILLSLIENLGFFNKVLLIDLELCIVEPSQAFFSLHPCQGLVCQVFFLHNKELKISFIEH